MEATSGKYEFSGNKTKFDDFEKKRRAFCSGYAHGKKDGRSAS